MKVCLSRSVLAAILVMAIGFNSVACDGDSSISRAPASDSAFSVMTIPCIKVGLTQLNHVGTRLDKHVTTCREDVRQAVVKVESAKRLLAEVRNDAAASLGLMVQIRDLLDQCGDYVCIAGESYCKEDLAVVLTLKLGQHAKLQQLETKRRASFAAAQKQLAAVTDRLAKWQRQQQELISRVDALRAKFAGEQAESDTAQHTAQESAALTKLDAVASALRVADRIEAELSSIGATTADSVAKPTTTASQAAAEFDRLLATGQNR